MITGETFVVVPTAFIISSLASRVGRGICLQPSFETFIATVIETEVDPKGEVFMRRIVSGVDTGIAVNPDTVKAQIEGGHVFGLTAALYGQITFAGGQTVGTVTKVGTHGSDNVYRVRVTSKSELRDGAKYTVTFRFPGEYAAKQLVKLR